MSSSCYPVSSKEQMYFFALELGNLCARDPSQVSLGELISISEKVKKSASSNIRETLDDIPQTQELCDKFGQFSQFFGYPLGSLPEDFFTNRNVCALTEQTARVFFGSKLDRSSSQKISSTVKNCLEYQKIGDRSKAIAKVSMACNLLFLAFLAVIRPSLLFTEEGRRSRITAMPMYFLSGLFVGTFLLKIYSFVSLRLQKVKIQNAAFKDCVLEIKCLSQGATT